MIKIYSHPYTLMHKHMHYYEESGDKMIWNDNRSLQYHIENFKKTMNNIKCKHYSFGIFVKLLRRE